MMFRPLLIAFAAMIAGLVSAQSNTPPTVKLSLPKEAKAGSKVQATVEVTFAEGLHGYQNPPSDQFQIPVTVTVDTKGFSVVKVAYPKGALMAMAGDPKPSAVYQGTVKIPVTITAPKSAGSTEVKVTVSYQQCNDKNCYPPAKISASGKLLLKK